MTAEEAPGITPENAEVRDLLHDFGERWAVLRTEQVTPGGKRPLWLAWRRPERGGRREGDNASYPIERGTPAELRARLEILDGRG